MMRVSSAVVTACLSFGAFVVPPAASAQEHPIVWTLVAAPKRATQGKTVSIKLHASIPSGWHLYAITQPPGGPRPTVITVPKGAAFAMAGAVVSPEPEIAPDPNFDILTETYADSVTFTVRLIARATAPAKLALRVSYQTCTDRYCLPPTADLLESPVLIAAAAPGTVIGEGASLAASPTAPPVVPPAIATKSATRAPAPSATRRQAAPASIGQYPTTASLPLFLWLAAVMGALSLLTPCVFPMIPITVSYFTKTSESSRSSPARNALVYAGGIMATFTILGMAIAMLVGAGGINRFAANPWVNLLVTAIFIAFACNLFGVWQFTLPSTLLTRLTAMSNGSRGGETIGILAMGLTFTLTSFTCTAPFVGTLLVMAARGSWQWPLLGLLVFSAVFALPFFLLALVPSAIAKLPRSGSWLNTVKVMMGFIEIATAMKFLANADMIWQWGIFTRTVILVIWSVTAAVAAAYLFGVFARAKRKAVPPLAVPRLQLGIGALCVLLTAFLANGLRGARLGELESFLPPPEGAITQGTASVRGELSWMVNDYRAALALAKSAKKPLLIDFTGYTCTNCRWMEANMFPRPDVARELERFVRVRLYTDGQGELYRAQQQMELDRFGTIALPYYAVVDSLGATQSQFLGMTRSSDEFLAFLRGAPPSRLLVQ